jgi:hypothetical protein
VLERCSHTGAAFAVRELGTHDARSRDVLQRREVERYAVRAQNDGNG